MSSAPTSIQRGGPRRVTEIAAPQVGERARPLDLADLAGQRFRLEDLRGRAFLLVFLRHAG